MDLMRQNAASEVSTSMTSRNVDVTQRPSSPVITVNASPTVKTVTEPPTAPMDPMKEKISVASKATNLTPPKNAVAELTSTCAETENVFLIPSVVTLEMSAVMVS
jgi:hypothetical protein